MNINGAHRLSSQLELRRTHEAHYPSPRERGGIRESAAGDGRASFAEALKEGISSVNESQQAHEAIAQLAITNPDRVDVHDVTIAAAKADLSIRLARNIIDRALNGYREITSLR